MGDVQGGDADPPVQRPCERIVYRTGLLNAAFSALFGMMAGIVAAWLLWELWSATAPKPITDDFLKLLNDSFARNWRDPRTWPWSRMGYAYGFTAVGIVLTVAATLAFSSMLARARPIKPAIIKIDTSQQFCVSP